MKSIMEEASSVSKAVEKAWIRAEKPASFTIKVLEEAEKNFFGLTSKPAKIAFYFEEVQVQQPKHKTQPQQPKHHPERQVSNQQSTEASRPERSRKPVAQQPNNRVQRPQQEQKPVKREMPQQLESHQVRREQTESSSCEWTTPIRADAEQWLNKAITAIRSDAHVDYGVSKNELQVTVNCSLAFNGNERMLCSSLAHLLMQALRTKFKNEIRGLRVHIKTAAL